MNQSSHRILVLGRLPLGLSAMTPEADREFEWRHGKTPLPAGEELNEFSAVLVRGPPLPSSRIDILPSGKSLPIVAVLHKPSAQDFERLRDLKIDEFLVEPYSSGELKVRLSRSIARQEVEFLRRKIGQNDEPFAQSKSTVRQTDEQIRLLLSRANDFGIFTTDLEGRVTSWNSGAEILFEYAASEIVGRNANLLFTLEDVERDVPAQERKTAAEAGRWEDERWHLRKSGERFWASGYAMPLHDGSTRGFLKIIRDRTEQKRFEEQVEEAVNVRTAQLRVVNEQLDNYASYVAHDLRSPVKTVHGLCEVMRDRLAEKIEEDDLALVDRVLRSTEKMSDLITRLLVYSRTITSPAPLEAIELDAIVHESIGKNSVLIATRYATFEVAPQLPAVMGAAFLLSQVVDNLVGNALKFCPKDRPPHLKIYADQSEKRVRLWVEDNGIGIDPKFHQRIFQPLQRLHSQGAYEGNGLGLTILVKAVERMNGTFGVNSIVDVGSRFWVELEKATVPARKIQRPDPLNS